MADEDLNQDSNVNTEDDNKSSIDENKNQEDPVQKLVKEKVAEALKDIKSKLDNAYGARDDALKKVAELEQAKKEAELQRLKDEGKHKEVLELQLAEEKSKREILERKTIELTRDLELRNVLSSYSFRNDNAQEMAYREIVTQLVQNEQSIWVHKSGVPLRDFVKQFTDDEANSFLLKVKSSSGSGSSSAKPGNTSSDDKKSLFSLSQEEVLKLAREGKLPGRR
jgi:hypothetical protein